MDAKAILIENLTKVLLSDAKAIEGYMKSELERIKIEVTNTSSYNKQKLLDLSLRFNQIVVELRLSKKQKNILKRISSMFLKIIYFFS